MTQTCEVLILLKIDINYKNTMYWQFLTTIGLKRALKAVEAHTLADQRGWKDGKRFWLGRAEFPLRTFR